ncbi:MAG: hypothetical protein LDL30_11055 [Desulfovibrio sp.]|nr:hypothetical protein [Desulfovibrio sp.]MCA1986095.1 hypothetical protein [Desulfovibrio sp.]
MHDIQHLLERHRKDMELLERNRRVSATCREQKLRELDRLLQEAMAVQQQMLQQERFAA